MRASLGAALLLGACAPGLPDELPDAGILPTAFFAGTACGRGVLTTPGGALEDRFVVTSRGEVVGENLVLDQAVRGRDGEVRSRRWVMRPDGPASYRGTLSGPDGLGASGEVRVRVAGPVMRIRYAVSGVPLGRMEQFLYLHEDGSSTNVGTVRVAGLPVRRLSERIEPQLGAAPNAERPCYEDGTEGG